MFYYRKTLMKGINLGSRSCEQTAQKEIQPIQADFMFSCKRVVTDAYTCLCNEPFVFTTTSTI